MAAYRAIWQPSSANGEASQPRARPPRCLEPSKRATITPSLIDHSVPSHFAGWPSASLTWPDTVTGFVGNGKPDYSTDLCCSLFPYPRSPEIPYFPLIITPLTKDQELQLRTRHVSRYRHPVIIATAQAPLWCPPLLTFDNNAALYFRIPPREGGY
jgi:hypothetical protein